MNLPSFFLLLFVCTAFRYWVYKNIPISEFASSLGGIYIYVLINYFFSLEDLNEKRFLKILILATFALMLYFCIGGCFYYFKTESLIPLFIINKSIFSIVLASVLSFFIHLFMGVQKKSIPSRIPAIFFYLLFFFSFVLIILLKGRAGWLGLSVGLIFILYEYQVFSLIKKIIQFLIYLLFPLFLTVLIIFKPNSSNGRLLIYKISASILKDNWLWGIGHGQFKVQYNQYQAAYFSSNSIDSKEALLADNTVFAFNDFFQFFIENGIIGFVLISVALYLLFKKIKRIETNPTNKHLFVAAGASLICILTGSLFSYPLQILPILLQGIVCLTIINCYPTTGIEQVKFCKGKSLFNKIIFIVFTFLLLIYFSFYSVYKYKSSQAYYFKRAGFRQKAIAAYKEISNSPFIDDNVLYSYAQELYYSNQLYAAKTLLDKSKKYFISNEVFKLSANLENELKNYTQAEKDYKTTVYMVPNRMISRDELLNFYLERKDTANAIYWAKSIINMPVKIPSQTTANIQQKAKETLIKLNR